MKTTTSTFGFTLVETIIAVVIIGIIAGIVAMNMSSFTSGQALNNGVDEVTALIDQARSRTLAAEGGTVYSVHLQSDRAVLFTGITYTSGVSTNKTVMLDNAITLTSISLSGGGSDVIFSQNTGDTNNFGTFIVKRSTTTAGQKTITINKTGIVSSD